MILITSTPPNGEVLFLCDELSTQVQLFTHEDF
nr:MAG TPA: hypothetical protein [Caudoviricetes sp.]